MIAAIFRFTATHAAFCKKAVEGHRTPRREAFADDSQTARSVLDCASPLALWPERGENGMVGKVERGLQVRATGRQHLRGEPGLLTLEKSDMLVSWQSTN
jgi:hypothetical protein